MKRFVLCCVATLRSRPSATAGGHTRTAAACDGIIAP
jgi:hypothetical protein